jgi:hypothetical protein
LGPSEYSVPLIVPGINRAVLTELLLVQSVGPAKYRPYCLGGPAMPLAISSAVRFFCRRAPPVTVKQPTRNLSSSFALRLRIPQRILANSQSCQLLSWAFVPYSTQGFGGPVHAGLPHPPPSAFRVWLPSARFTPSEPVSVLFHTDGALGIHPSELTPPTRYRVVFDPMNPRTVFPAVATVAGATGRPGRPRFLGFNPRESPWRFDA